MIDIFTVAVQRIGATASESGVSFESLIKMISEEAEKEKDGNIIGNNIKITLTHLIRSRVK